MTRALIGVGWLMAAVSAPATAAEAARTDVVVVVDTSASMREAGMDPERSSLLVSKLLADISPGNLAVVRLLDLQADSDLIPNRPSGRFIPCSEDPSQQCNLVEPASDWQADARANGFGLLSRRTEGDVDFKRSLETHLAQRSNNSPFDLSFRAAQGWLERQRGAEDSHRQTILWLSDGRTDEPRAVAPVVSELAASGVNVEAIVFGRGDETLPRSLGLETHRVKSPAELMKAFAGAFRRIVQAPYEVDALLSAAPTFEMKQGVDEAWVVVYGDDTLGGAELTGPGGAVAADEASERWAGAGAYRVAHLSAPSPGRWTISASGGGSGVAYAVIQRSSLAPRFEAPRTALAGVPTLVVGGIVAGLGEALLEDPAVLAEARLTATIGGEEIELRDDGSGGDERAGDGHFSALATFVGQGDQTVGLRLRTPLVDRSIDAKVAVSGRFRVSGGPLTVDLGRLEAGTETCRTVVAPIDHQGHVPLALRALRTPPAGHELAVRSGALRWTPGGPAQDVGPELPFEVCLAADRDAASSRGEGEPYLELALAASQGAKERLVLALTWEVVGLSFWARWGGWILLILALLILLGIILGYVLPERFQPNLALVFVPSRAELDEQIPQPVRSWQGVGIGFYRNARAYLHADYRLSGRAAGALAGLEAQHRATRVHPGKGSSLFRETLDGDWEPVAPEGRPARQGDIFRISERGPFFRITSHRSGS